MVKPKLILIGASSGGVAAFHEILAALPANFGCPVVIVHHLPTQSKVDTRLVYGTKAKMQVDEVEDKQTLLPGRVYFAPPDYHLLIESDLSVSFDVSEPVNFSRPSIDVTFLSAADSLGPAVAAFLLTGANSDGAQGILEIQNRGGVTFIQDPTEAESSRMPASAVALSPSSQIVRLAEIPPILMEIVGVR